MVSSEDKFARDAFPLALWNDAFGDEPVVEVVFRLVYNQRSV